MIKNQSIVYVLAIIAIGLCASQDAAAALLMQWGPDGLNTRDIKTTGTDVPGNTLSKVGGLAIVQQSGHDYAIGTGATYKSASNAAGGDWEPNDINIASVDSASLDLNDYLSLIVESTDQDMQITDVYFNIWRNGGAAAPNFAVYYSVDGGSFTQAGANQTISGSGASGGAPVEIAAIGASGLTINAAAGEDVEFRVYAWGASNGNGNHHTTGGSISGSIVPEPASLALMGLGVLAIAGRRRRS